MIMSALRVSFDSLDLCPALTVELFGDGAWRLITTHPLTPVVLTS
jgi:hypothetical protein